MRSSSRVLGVVLLVLLLFTPFAFRAEGRTITVPADQPTVQAGLDAATAGDTVLVLPGTYVENLVMAARHSGVRLRSSVTGGAILDGGARDRVFRCTDLSADTEIRGFVIRNGRTDASSPPPAGIGAGISLIRASPLIAENVIEGNHGDGAAGIDAQNSSPIIEDNTIRDNVCTYDGGGIRFYATGGVIRRNRFENNTVQGDPYGAGAGGGLASGGGATTAILDNVVTGNYAGWGPGGIYLGDGSNCEIRGNLVEGNRSPSLGGGIRLRLSTATISNNVIVGNVSGDLGGGILVHTGLTAVIENNTVVANQAPRGGGVYVQGGSSLNRNIIVRNDGDGGGVSMDGPVTLGCNDVWSNLPSDYVGGVAGPGDFSSDPLFCDPEVDDYRLQSGSPCVHGFGCGLVGALDVGCSATATQPVTWSGLKHLYR